MKLAAMQDGLKMTVTTLTCFPNTRAKQRPPAILPGTPAFDTRTEHFDSLTVCGITARNTCAVAWEFAAD